MGKFIVYNNSVVEAGEINISTILLEKPFVLGQTMWYGFGNIPLFYEHVEQVNRQTELLNMPLPKVLKNPEELFRITKRMLNKNRYYRSGIIRLQLIRDGDSPILLLSSTSSESFDLPFPEKGIFLQFAHQKKYSFAEPAAYTFYNESLWEIVKAELKGPLSGNAIIMNEKGYVSECIKSNIYMIRNNTLFTPSLQTGCYGDLLRKYVLHSAGNLDLEVTESSEITREALFQMDEIFLAGEETGFIKVTGIENKRYLQRLTGEIYLQVNRQLREKASVH